MGYANALLRRKLKAAEVKEQDGNMGDMLPNRVRQIQTFAVICNLYEHRRSEKKVLMTCRETLENQRFLFFEDRPMEFDVFVRPAILFRRPVFDDLRCFDARASSVEKQYGIRR